jgi:hypothetical protein
MSQSTVGRGKGVFFTLCIPLWDCGYAIGLLSGGLYVNGTLSLASYWALVSLGSTLPLVPLLVMHLRRRAVAAP